MRNTDGLCKDVVIEEHVECNCGCRITANDCNSLQVSLDIIIGPLNPNHSFQRLSSGFNTEILDLHDIVVKVSFMPLIFDYVTSDIDYKKKQSFSLVISSC